VNEGNVMAKAGELFESIKDFLELSASLELTRSEERTLLSLDAEAWEVWRSFSTPRNADAPPLLMRRLTYALSLLRRMAAGSTTPAPSSRKSSETRI
jgi:hypothetical protein